MTETTASKPAIVVKRTTELRQRRRTRWVVYVYVPYPWWCPHLGGTGGEYHEEDAFVQKQQALAAYPGAVIQDTPPIDAV